MFSDRINKRAVPTFIYNILLMNGQVGGSSREQKKIQQAIRIMERQEDARKKSANHENKPRKMRKTTHYVENINGSNRDHRNTDEVVQDTNSATCLTPQNSKHQQGEEKGKKKGKNVLEENKSEHLNEGYPLRGMELTQYITLYDFQQKERYNKKQEKVEQNQELSGTDIPILTNIDTMKVVERVREALKKMKNKSKITFSRCIAKQFKDNPPEKKQQRNKPKQKDKNQGEKQQN